MTGSFTAGAVLTATNLNNAINTMTTNAQTGTAYTFVLADAGKLVTASNGSASTYTIPLNSSVAYVTGTTIELLNIGAGTVTVAATGGVTLSGTTSIPTNGRVRLTKTGTDTWWSSAMDAAAGGGLVYITSASFSGSSAVNVNNCWTSSYAHYRVVIDYDPSANANLTMRLRASAADNSTTNYKYGQMWGTYANSSSVGGGTGQSSWVVGTTGTTTDPAGISIDVLNPQAALYTHFIGSLSYENGAGSIGGIFVATTQFDGFSLIPGSGTITGTLRVYGYKNS